MAVESARSPEYPEGRDRRFSVNFERYISEKYPPSVRRGCKFKSSRTCSALSMHYLKQDQDAGQIVA